jgi:hypothetical protein
VTKKRVRYAKQTSEPGQPYRESPGTGARVDGQAARERDAQ